MIEALSSVEFQVTEQQWDDMTHRLRLRIISENYKAPAPRRSRWVAWDFGIPALTAMAAVMLVTIGLYRLAAPIVEQPTQSTLAPLLDSLMDQPVILDPVTADFLEQSELLLRNVMKLEASNAEDVEEAKQLAMRHLINIDQRMAAAAGIRPVQTVMSKYETILRDLRNLNDETAAEDISDIQHRIERNGLIAGIKAFQPPAPVFDIDER
ncbi:MAG: hypothetical protein HY646_05440 [Acidobacteria bacterium]|nr:hypothetical protein [Acidobacteriota bacterium]